MGTPTWPPGVPPFAALIRAYTSLIQRTARRRGIRAADIPDCAQRVLLRLHRAIVEGRLDASRPIGGWVMKTTRSVARDFLAMSHAQQEVLAPTGILDPAEDTADPEERMNEAIDVHTFIDRILAKLPPKQREVFVMHDLEDTPMPEVIEELHIATSTAYDRLRAAREAFAREWEAMRRSADVAVLPVALLGVADLIAADHAIPEAPQSLTDALLRRLAIDLGPDFTGSVNTSLPGSTGTTLGAAAGAARVSTVTLTTRQLALGALLAGLAGAGLHAMLRPIAPTPTQTMSTSAPWASTPVMVASAGLPEIDSAVPTFPTTPPDSASSAPPVESQAKLLDNARVLLGDHKPTKALAMLARVTDPDLAGERDRLRRLALAAQSDAGM